MSTVLDEFKRFVLDFVRKHGDNSDHEKASEYLAKLNELENPPKPATTAKASDLRAVVSTADAPEWDPYVEYPETFVVRHLGKVYVATRQGSGYEPDESPAYWKLK